MTTLAPSRASVAAQAAPIPDAPPVTIATLPSTWPIAFSPFLRLNRLASSNGSTFIKPDRIIPQELSIPLSIHLPVQHDRRRLGEMAFAMRIVRRTHQHVIA